MGLELKGVPVTSKRTKERRRMALDILKEIKEELKRMGVPDYPQPNHVPTALSDIDVNALSNQELQSQYTMYIGYAQYISPKLAELEVSYKISASLLKDVTASLKVSLTRDGVAKSELSARVIEAPEYIDQELEHLKIYGTKTILKAYYKSYSNQAAALSRVIEIRKLDFEQEHRGNNNNNFKKSQGGMPGRLRR